MNRAFYCATLSICLLVGGPTQAAPPSVTVGWASVLTGRPFAGKTTVTEIVPGPPIWGYRITGTRVDRVTIDLDVPCEVPKSSGAPTITPAKGPSQHYVITFGSARTTRTISIPCNDAKPGGNATFTMLGFLIATKKLIHWEFPRLCRGGSRSLTFQGVVCGHPSMKLRFVSRQSTRTMEFHQWTSSRA
jgi:hypothetical protein